MPVSFYKIVVDEVVGKPRMLAFLMPQDVRGDEPPAKFLPSVDRIEEKTGLDFFSDLDPVEQEKLEAETAPDLW